MTTTRSLLNFKVTGQKTTLGSIFLVDQSSPNCPRWAWENLSW